MRSVRNNPDDKKIVLLKSWNEWAEGNHLEPDLRFGLSYLKAIKNSIKNNSAT